VSADLLHQKIDSLKAYPHLASKTEELARFETFLRQASDWELFRMNPLQVARRIGLEADLCIDFFIHGAKLGLFDFDWNLLCPGCGGVEYSVQSMDQIQSNLFHCTICNIDVTTELDHQIEVAFTLNKGIRPLDIDPFVSFENYRRYFFSANYERSRELNEYSHSHFVNFAVLAPDAHHSMVFQPEKGSLYRLLSMVTHTEMYLRQSDAQSAGQQKVEVDINNEGFMNRELRIGLGEMTLEIHNRTKRVQAAALLKTNFELMHRILKEHPNTRQEFLTAKMLLNHQSFRDLFRAHTLARDFSLNVKNLTVLFTDLQGSTAMYDRAGDFSAYRLVQKHFDLSLPIVRQHAGAVVKTMGDSIMATFSNPADAMATAVEMIRQVRQENKKLKNFQIEMRVGLHEGPALVVNVDERLDYFGQTVNIASRVKDFSQFGEVWVTDPVYHHDWVRSMMEREPMDVHPHTVTLKGIENPVTLYQCVLTA